MDIRTTFEHLRKFDTPTICNALEIVRGKRFTSGFTRQRLLASFPALPSIVGYARTAMFRSSIPFDPAARRQKLKPKPHGNISHAAPTPASPRRGA